jgi:hypothetical protein
MPAWTQPCALGTRIAFSIEDGVVIVATIAFGIGIATLPSAGSI